MNHDAATHSVDSDTPHSPTTEAAADSSLIITAVGSLAAMGSAMAARSLLRMAYRKATGAEPPSADDPRVSFGLALRWTLMTAVTAAVIELVVHRATARFAKSPHSEG